MRVCNLRKNKNLTKIGDGLPACKKVLFCQFLVLVVFCFFFSLCFCAFVLHKITQNGYVPAFLEVFCRFFPQKACLKLFFSSHFVFFCFCLPFQRSIFLYFCPSTPFLNKKIILGFLLFCFLCERFSFSNVCLFVWNKIFLTSPFWNPNCFHFWHFFVIVLFSWCMLSLSVSMLVLFGVFSVFVLCFCFVLFLVLLSVYEKVVFPAILVFFLSCVCQGMIRS